jgi:hypothetical protein
MKKIAILQSNYLPWKGVFDMINQVDNFVFYENVQYTRHDWRNRNSIKTPQGLKWLTVPIKKVHQKTKIFEVEIFNNEDWQQKHYNLIKENYSEAPYFWDYHFILEEIYFNKKWNRLSDLNIYSTKLIASALGIKTQFINSLQLKIDEEKIDKTDKIIQICKKLNADYLLDGPAAQSFILKDKFKKENIKLEYINYEYPEYKQLYREFAHNVTVLDVIFNCGPNSPKYIFNN